MANYPATQTFWIGPSGLTARAARRYSGCVGQERCPSGANFHNATIWVDRVKTETYQDKDGTRMRREIPPLSDDAEVWPTTCDHCDYAFTDGDPFQTFDREIYIGYHGREYVLGGRLGNPPPDTEVAPPGAMWHAYWLPSGWRGDDGIALAVCLPNGDTWLVDSQASNCTRPGEPHKCWIRHGDPRTGNVTVDKDGDTCPAGAGSIAAGDYHGFMINGELTAG